MPVHCFLEGALACTSVCNTAWQGEWLLVGTDDGTLKTLKISPVSPLPGLAGSANTGCIHSADVEPWHTQCHRGHQGPVCCMSADILCGLLATGDSDGNIRVWEEAEGQWRQLSFFCLGVSGALVGIQWVPYRGCSRRMSLCLLHDDGHLFCVTLEGQRLWSRDVKKCCSCFCASPNGNGFVLASKDGEVAFHDSRGIYIRKLGLKFEAAGQEGITALAWQPGSWAVRPILVVYASGYGVLLQTDGDAQPLSVETGLSSCVAASWNPSGMLAALLGLPGLATSPAAKHFTGEPSETVTRTRRESPDPGMLVVLVQACGKLIATINLASAEPCALAWANSGDRLVAAAEKGVFILSLRRHAVCCSYGESTVAAASPFSRKQMATDVSFLHGPGGYRTVRRFRGPRFLVPGESLCAVVPQATPALPLTFLWQADRFGALLQSQHHEGPHRLPDDTSFYQSPSALKTLPRETGQEGFPVELCDTSGNTVETVISPLGPAHAILLPHWLVIADSSHHLWLYHLSREEHSADAPVSPVIDLNTVCALPSADDCSGNTCALGGRGKCLIVARTTGQLLRLRPSRTSPKIQLEASAVTRSQLCSLKLNREATALAGLDLQGRLHIIAATAPYEHTGNPSCFAAKLCDPVEAVLDYMWASDHDDLIAVLQQRGLLLIYTRCQGGNPSLFFGVETSKEPPIGPLYLVEFCNLCARALCISTLLQQTIAERKQEILKAFDAEPLLQMRNLLGTRQQNSDDLGGIAALQQAAAFAARLNHPILWRLLAEAALASEEMGITEEALVRGKDTEAALVAQVNETPSVAPCKILSNIFSRSISDSSSSLRLLRCEDYCSLQVLKQARLLNPRGEGRPFIAALSGDILGAGAFYEAQQKLEHAIHLFISFGMWQAASDTLKFTVSAPSRGEQNSLQKVRMALADAWKEQGNWIPAIELYSSLKPQEGLLEAYFLSGKYEELEGLARKLSEADKGMLLRAAQLLAASGKGAASADAFVKAGMPERAVDAALYGGEWAQAVSLARQYCNSTKVHGVTSVYRNAIQHQHKKCSSPDIMEAFLSIGAFEAAAHELASLPRQQGHLPRNPRKQRKMHIMAALLSRKHHFKAGHEKENCLNTPCEGSACFITSEARGISGVSRCILAHSLNSEEAHHWHSAEASHLYLLCCSHVSEHRVHAALCSAVRLWECYQREFSPYISAQLLFISAYKSKEWDLCSQALHVMQTDAPVSPCGKQRLEAAMLLVFSRRHVLEAPWSCQLPCPNCSALSSYWECFCPSCDFSFPWCAATGLPVRYARYMTQQSSTYESGENRNAGSPASAACAATSPSGLENVWPFGGPSVPEACGLCGLLTAAWGPEGPLVSCPLCSQPFFCTPKEGNHPEIPAQSLTPEDIGGNCILNVDIEDILFQSGNISKLASP